MFSPSRLIRTLIAAIVFLSACYGPPFGGGRDAGAEELRELPARHRTLIENARSAQISSMSASRGNECIGDSHLWSPELRNYCFSPRIADFDERFDLSAVPIPETLSLVLKKLLSAKPISIMERLTTCQYRPGWKVKLKGEPHMSVDKYLSDPRQREDGETATLLFCFNCDVAAVLGRSGKRNEEITYFDIRPFRAEALLAFKAH
jgi:hypothetical protein